MDMTYDVIIIGAGSIGLPAALAMAQAGLQVLVLDGAASPGQGSHKAAIGGVRATHSEPAKIALCLRSLEIFAHWGETYGQDIGWCQDGYSFVAYGEREAHTLRSLLATQQAHGLDIAWLEPEGLLRIIPDLNPRGLLGGTYSPNDGHCQTLLAGYAFYEEARRAGATFHFREHVTGIQTRDGHVAGVITDRGSYNAAIVLNAAGAWAHQIGRMVGADHAVHPDSHEAGITEPVARFLKPLVVDIRPQSGSANCYFHQLADGQVCFCLTPDPPVLGFDCRATSAFLPQIAQRMVGLMPRLATLHVRRTWRGLYPTTPDGAPLVGWGREVEGYLVAIGMCGQGFMLGPGIGELLSRMVTQTEVSPADQTILENLSPYRTFSGTEALR